MHLVTRIDGNRIRLMESGPLSGPYAGQTKHCRWKDDQWRDRNSLAQKVPIEDQ